MSDAPHSCIWRSLLCAYRLTVTASIAPTAHAFSRAPGAATMPFSACVPRTCTVASMRCARSTATTVSTAPCSTCAQPQPQRAVSRRLSGER